MQDLSRVNQNPNDSNTQSAKAKLESQRKHLQAASEQICIADQAIPFFSSQMNKYQENLNKSRDQLTIDKLKAIQKEVELHLEQPLKAHLESLKEAGRNIENIPQELKINGNIRQLVEKTNQRTQTIEKTLLPQVTTALLDPLKKEIQRKEQTIENLHSAENVYKGHRAKFVIVQREITSTRFQLVERYISNDKLGAMLEDNSVKDIFIKLIEKLPGTLKNIDQMISDINKDIKSKKLISPEESGKLKTLVETVINFKERLERIHANIINEAIDLYE